MGSHVGFDLVAEEQARLVETGIEAGPLLPDSVLHICPPESGTTPAEQLELLEESIRDARFCVALANNAHGESSQRLGKLSDFCFTTANASCGNDEASRVSFKPLYFRPSVFCNQIKQWFGITAGQKWKLWSRAHAVCPLYQLSSAFHFWAALKDFENYFRAFPYFESEAFFLVEVLPNSHQAALQRLPAPPSSPGEHSQSHTPRSSASARVSITSVSKTTAKAAPRLSKPPAVTKSLTREVSNQAKVAPGPARRSFRQWGKSSQPPRRLPRPAESTCVKPDDVTAASSDGDSEVDIPTYSAQQQDRPCILSHQDTDARKGDILEGDLHAIIPASESPSDSKWAECCRLLLLDPGSHKVPEERSVKIPGAEIHATPRQFWTAYQMLTCRSDRGMCGGILADVPGMGKTHVCIVLCLLRALIFHNVAVVKKDWEQRTGNHSPENIKGDTPCKCKNSMGIECYSNPGGVTRCIARTLTRGPALIQAPPGVIEEWKSALVSARLSSTYYHPLLFHTKAPPQLEPPADLKSLFKTTAALAKKSIAKEADHPPTVEECTYTYNPSESRHGKEPERLILLTTHSATLLQASFQIPVSSSADNTWRKSGNPTVYGCPVGLHLVDEFHMPEARLSFSGPASLAHQHKHIRRGDCDFWSVTGTPMPDSLKDLEMTLDILHRREWESTEHRHHGRQISRLVDLSRAHQDATKEDATPDQQDRFRTLAQDFFTHDFVIRNTEDSTFFGRMITRMGSIKPDVWAFFTPNKFIASVQAIAREVQVDLAAISAEPQKAIASAKGYLKLERLQVLSTFPGAARLMLSGKMRFDRDALRAAIRKLEDRTNVLRVPLFRECFPDVIEDSPKLAFILQVINYMQGDCESRPRRRADQTAPAYAQPDDLQMKKMVILTPSLGEAIFLFMGIRKLNPAAKPVLFHHELKSSEKTSILADWNKLTAVARHRVFIAPFELAGTGLNLQMASYQVLTGPLRFKTDEVQCFRRTNREGQQLSLVHFMLMTEDNPCDRLVVTRQAKRVIRSEPFSISTDLELEEQDIGNVSQANGLAPGSLQTA